MSTGRSKFAVKQMIVLALLQSVLTVIASGKKNGRLCILNYHRVLDKADPFRASEVDVETFTWHMSLLKDYFNVLPLREAIILNRNRNLPARAICVTFDDGYADNETNALPILESVGIPATFFIASGCSSGGCMWNDIIIESVSQINESQLDLTDFNLGVFSTSTTEEKIRAIQLIIDQSKYMPHEKRQAFVEFIATFAHKLPANLMLNPSQIKRLHSAGMEIASHTITHPILSKISDRKAMHEISESKNILENIINDKVSLFAYPNGFPSKDFSTEHVEMVKNAGFEAAVTTKWGVADHKSDQWQLPRFLPWNTTKEKFMLNLLRNYLRVV